MNNFNEVHNRLIEMNFKALENNEVEELGFSLYENETLRVFLKQIHIELELENIKIYSNQIRALLSELSGNIYNSYLILSIEEEIDYEKFYIIERDNVSLRKYVVRDKNDLNRIPFLDKFLNKSEDNNINNYKESESENLPELNSIFTLLDQYDSKNIKLKDNQIEDIVKTIMQGMELGYEN